MIRVHDVSMGGRGRRAFLRIGSLGLAGLSLGDLTAARNALAAAGYPVQDRSVVFVFMHGGPSQIETFDPKMDAPAEVRSVTGEVRTAIPGLTYGGTFQRLAKRAHRTAVVRSFVTGDGNHDIKPVVGKNSLGANLGSLYARVAGTNRIPGGMPSNVALFPRAVDAEAQPAEMSFGRFDAPGPLGAAYAPFVPGAGGGMQEDLELRIPRSRLDDRRGLLERFDGFRRAWEGSGVLDGISGFRAQALDAILGGVADAFDLSQEDPRTLARYDTSPLVRPEAIDRKWNNHQNYRDHSQTLGKLLLLARRMCERGCGFVTVTTNFVWDMHADVNNATMAEGMGYVGTPFDHAVAAFLDDVAERGLSDRILLVACGEMGRTPRINEHGGRDHWGRLAPLLLAGGGLRMGQVIGESSRDAGEPAADPVTIDNLTATILHTLLDPGEVRLMDNLPRDLVRLISSGEPIRQLI
ncbi:MAG TPA: DUF1501 domain-containing protein [Verrucomicrobiales bacterium]|nr:DUF1501 domain-containing protein [Verrucomicrobiales bacterium]